jgi:hypothetical protein
MVRSLERTDLGRYPPELIINGIAKLMRQAEKV